MTTPILVIAFNRPDTLAILLATLKRQGASNLYFAVDGPRAQRSDDRQRVEQVKAIIQREYSPPPSRCLYQDLNLGIRRGPPAAISWFFENEEEGIILEDDCIPGDSFFSFVEWALVAYRNEDQVKLISGFNRFAPQDWKESFRFVKTAMIWGWASWRRAWVEYDPEMLAWDSPKEQVRFRNWSRSFQVFDFWRTSIEWVRIGKLVTWDVAWCWTVFRSHGLGVMPRVSLIQNIGFGSDSTNTSGGDDRAGVVSSSLLPPFIGPSRLAADLKFQRKLDRAEFWRTDDTLGGRLRLTLRNLKRMLLAR